MTTLAMNAPHGSKNDGAFYHRMMLDFVMNNQERFTEQIESFSAETDSVPTEESERNIVYAFQVFSAIVAGAAMVEHLQDKQHSQAIDEVDTPPSLPARFVISPRVSRQLSRQLSRQTRSERTYSYDCDYAEETIETLKQEIDELDEEIEFLSNQLKRYKKKNKKLADESKAKSNSIFEIEEKFAEMKVELARARANEDNLMVWTQEAIAERDIKILELSNDLDEAQRGKKKITKDLKKMEKKLTATEKLLLRKEGKLQDVSCDRDTLRESLKAAKRLLKMQEFDVDLTDDRDATETPSRTWRLLTRRPGRRRPGASRPPRPDEKMTIPGE